MKILEKIGIGLFLGWIGISDLNAAVMKVSSGFLARGEKALLQVVIEGDIGEEFPVIPEVPGLDIELLGLGTPKMVPGSKVEYPIQYLVSSYKAGAYQIPPLKFEVDGKVEITNPINLEVFDPSDLVWSEGVSTPEQIGDTVKYASILKVSEGKFFENQTKVTELKLYIPRKIAAALVDSGVPEFERDGLALWRFEANDMKGEVNLLGQSYISLSYSTTMTSLRSGPVSLGPTTVRLTYEKIFFDRFTQRADMQVTLNVAEKNLDILPLPEGAPEGFENAVGQFNINAKADQVDVTEGDPISVDVIVNGQGNLDIIKSPKLLDESGWKVYEATASQRGEERREINGTVVFKQFLRPLEVKPEVPAFRFVYFDPIREEYVTLTTKPIPLNMKSSTKTAVEASGIVQKMPVPVERMTDILGTVIMGNLLTDKSTFLPRWLLHGIGALLAVLLILKALWMRFGHLLEKDQRKAEMKKDFQRFLDTKSSGTVDFLRAAGGFAEKWLGGVNDSDLKKVLEQRDEVCFRPEKQNTGLDSERKREIIQVLKRVAFSAVVIFFILGSSGKAKAGDLATEAREAYESAKFGDAAEKWLSAGDFNQLSPDTLYNLGNSAYRLGVPGEAALYYRRALAKDAGHQEARQNLRFMERKYGSIIVERSTFQYVLTNLSLASWKNVFWGGLWMIGLGILVFPATRPMAAARVAGVIGLILGPLMISAGALGWYYFPDDAKFAPLERQAVIVAENVVLHTDAARTSPQVIDAPPGSLVDVIQVSGKWAYVAFATKTRGWVPLEYIGMLIPKEKPKVPKVRKAISDGSSA